MAESIVETGLRIQAQQAADAATRAQLEADLAADASITDLAGQIVSLLGSVMDCLNQLTQLQLDTQAMVCATRVRMPVRDELGTIQYVVDEMQAPAWAQPVTPAGPASAGEY